MSVDVGTRLGSLEITALLGKGGMGEVYRARDTRLDRDVAIKTLPEEFAVDEDRLARFQREAKLLASLNHPNIAAIYGLEKFDSRHFLVLELVEGETLADHIARGTILVDESLRLAVQIAEALQAAHERGVIHRDLKPANIKITPDGTVKVLEFGLAKPTSVESPDVEGLSNSPTLRTLASSPGMILGTAAYMSPEQAKGRSVDRRTDIWAFGCVLYEMLTSKRAFEDENISDTLAAVLRAEPDWNAVPKELPPRDPYTAEELPQQGSPSADRGYIYSAVRNQQTARGGGNSPPVDSTDDASVETSRRCTGGSRSARSHRNRGMETQALNAAQRGTVLDCAARRTTVHKHGTPRACHITGRHSNCLCRKSAAVSSVLIRDRGSPHSRNSLSRWRTNTGLFARWRVCGIHGRWHFWHQASAFDWRHTN